MTGLKLRTASTVIERIKAEEVAAKVNMIPRVFSESFIMWSVVTDNHSETLAENVLPVWRVRHNVNNEF